MTRLNCKMPKMCNDRGRAFAWHEGKRHYFGVTGTDEADKNYKRFIHELTKEPTVLPQGAETIVEHGNVLVAELANAFLKHHEPRLHRGVEESVVWQKRI